MCVRSPNSYVAFYQLWLNYSSIMTLSSQSVSTSLSSKVFTRFCLYISGSCYFLFLQWLASTVHATDVSFFFSPFLNREMISVRLWGTMKSGGLLVTKDHIGFENEICFDQLRYTYQYLHVCQSFLIHEVRRAFYLRIQFRWDTFVDKPSSAS